VNIWPNLAAEFGGRQRPAPAIGQADLLAAPASRFTLLAQGRQLAREPIGRVLSMIRQKLLDTLGASENLISGGLHGSS
jgi:hypothetical protein